LRVAIAPGVVCDDSAAFLQCGFQFHQMIHGGQG